MVEVVNHVAINSDHPFFGFRIKWAMEDHHSITGVEKASSWYSLRPARSVHFDYFQSNHLMFD
jgi:hypothetical protein